MSMTLNLTCETCEKTLWVGQHSNGVGWYLYTGVAESVAALNAFVNEHTEHQLKFQNSDSVNFDYEDVTDYKETT
jgi:hypothetical protein